MSGTSLDHVSRESNTPRDDKWSVFVRTMKTCEPTSSLGVFSHRDHKEHKEPAGS